MNEPNQDFWAAWPSLGRGTPQPHALRRRKAQRDSSGARSSDSANGSVSDNARCRRRARCSPGSSRSSDVTAYASRSLRQRRRPGISGTSSPGGKSLQRPLSCQNWRRKTLVSAQTQMPETEAAPPPPPGTAPAMLLPPDAEQERGPVGDRSRTRLGSPVPSRSLDGFRVNTGCNRGSSSYTRATSSSSTTSGSAPHGEMLCRRLLG